MGDTGLRGEADRLAGLGERSRQIVAIGEGDGQVEMGGSRIRRQLHDLLKQSNAVARFAHLDFRFADGRQGSRILRSEREGLIQLLLGIRQVALLSQNQAEVEMALLIVGIVFKCLPKQLRGGGHVALPGANHGQIAARLDELRIEIKRGLEPLLGPWDVSIGQFQLA
jgi:hypothetical protein